ncbi:MAG: hypothetical protein HY951_14005 [Bacteroidia bacterium]|nr:hypothetical protein [Bacteroidia bacterium]
MTQNTENKELFNKENPFKVPEGYFENFAERVMQQIDSETRLAPKVTMWNTWKGRVAVAASVLIVSISSIGIYQYTQKPQINNINIAETAKVTITADTSDAELSFVDENQIVDVITTNNFTEIKVEGDDIIDYLVDDDVDMNLIAEAY